MVGPDYEWPAVEQPARFKSRPASEAAPPIATEWCKSIATPSQLFIATAIASNQTLQQAVARVDEARAIARVAGSFLYPTISGNPSFARTRFSGNRDSATMGQPWKECHYQRLADPV